MFVVFFEPSVGRGSLYVDEEFEEEGAVFVGAVIAVAQSGRCVVGLEDVWSEVAFFYVGGSA